MQAALWVNKTGPKICQDEILEAYVVCLSCSLQLDVFFVVFFFVVVGGGVVFHQVRFVARPLW